MEILSKSRTRFKTIATVTSHLDRFVLWMNLSFHGSACLHQLSKWAPGKARDNMRIVRVLQAESAIHGLKELGVVLCRSQLVEQKFDGVNVLHWMQKLA